MKSLVKQFEYQATAAATASSDTVSSSTRNPSATSNHIGTDFTETQQTATGQPPNKTAVTASHTNSDHHLLTDPAISLTVPLRIDLAEPTANARSNPIHLLADTPSPRDEALCTPRDSIETVTPRGTTTESYSAYSTAASTPRDQSSNVVPHPRKSVGGSSSKQRSSKGPKSGIPKKARDLEKRYHLVFLKALEWQYYLEQLIADYKDHSSSSGSDADEPLTKCRRLSASSAESVYSSSSSLRPQSSTAVSRSGSELGSSRENSPVRATDSPLSQADAGAPLSARPNPDQVDDVDGVTSVVEPATGGDLVDGPGGRLAGATEAAKSRRSSGRHSDSPKSVRRRAESVAAKRKPRRKKRRLAAADDAVRSDNDEDQLRATFSKGCVEYELNISETGSYIEDDYVCVSDSGPRTRSVRHDCDSVNAHQVQPLQQDGRKVQHALPEASRPDAALLTDDLQIEPTSALLKQGEKTNHKNSEEQEGLEAEEIVQRTQSDQVCSTGVTGEQRMVSPIEQSDLSSEKNPASDVDMTVLPKSKTTTNMEEENHVNGNVIDGGVQHEEEENKSSPHQGSPNRAIYEFKHQDTDVEESPQLRRKGVVNLTETQFNTISEKDDSVLGSSENVSPKRETSHINLNLSGFSRTSGRRSWPQQQDPYDDSESEALQKLIDSAILDPNWLQGGSDGFDVGSQEEGVSDEHPALETMDTGSEEGILQPGSTPVAPAKFDSAIHQLVNAAEHLVQATPLPSPIVSPRIPLSFNLTPRSQASPRTLPPLHFGVPSESATKQLRIQSWLATQRPAPALLDSCDASGEMTTGESDGESSDSADFTQNTQIARDLPQSVVSTPVADRTGCAMPFGSEPSKAVARSRRRRAGERRRPWSVTEHLARLSSLPASAPSQALLEPSRSGASAQPMVSPRSHLSTSDPALRVQSNASRLPNGSPADGQLSSSQTDMAESINVSEDQKFVRGPQPSAFELRGCASDSALDRTAAQRLCSNSPGASRFDHQLCTATSNASSTAHDGASLQHRGGLFSPCHSISHATTYSGGASTLASTPAGGAPTIPEHPHLGASPTGSGVQRRRKHKLRRRSNISLHTRGSDSGSDRLTGVSGAACLGHRLSLSASSDGGAAARHRLGGIVKSSSFAGHPLCTPALPVSPSSTLGAAAAFSSDSHCCAGVGPCNHSLCVASSVTSQDGHLQSSDLLASADGSATNTPTPRMSCASARSSSILLRSSALNMPGRPLSYAVPLTVLSSSSDNSDKSHAGSPVKEMCPGGVPRVAALALASSRIANSDVEATVNQEDISSHSEQAWDPFLENKYLSENYSEDLDTEAAKKFLEFGDDYRTYIDSDGGSSFFGVPKLRGLDRRGGHDLASSVSDRSLLSSHLTGVREFNETPSDVSKGAIDVLQNTDRSTTSDQCKSESNFSTKANGEDQVSDSNNRSSLSSDHGKSPNSSVIERQMVATDTRATGEAVSKVAEKAVIGTSLRSARKHRASGGITRGGLDVDSDSDMEDLMVMIEESKSQLVVAESVLNKHSGEAAATLLMDYSEILSLCLTNLSGLQDVLQHGPPSMGANRAIITGLIQRWEAVQRQALNRQQQSRQLHALHSTIKQLHLNLDALQQHYTASEGKQQAEGNATATDVADGEGEDGAQETEEASTSTAEQKRAPAADAHSLQQLQDRLAIAQAREDRLSEIQAELSQLSLRIHHHSTDSGHQLPQLQHQLHHLYQQSDHLSHCISSELSRLTAACSALEAWQRQAEELRNCLQQDDATLSRLQEAVSGGPAALSRLQLEEGPTGVAGRSGDSLSGTARGLANILAQGQASNGSASGGVRSFGGSSSRLSDSGTSGYESCSSDDLSERERRLHALKRLAAELEGTLHPHSLAWTNIKKTISVAENELSSLQKRCRELLLQTAERVAPSTTTTLCTRASRRRAAGNQSRISRTGRHSPSRSGRSNAKVAAPRNGWLWRVVRFALPIQAALLLLFCVSCLLEPSCCDNVNTFNMELGPQVRFIHGLPPV